MSRPVIVGIDGSAASLAAAVWAAREAELRSSPLHLVAAWPASAGTPPDAPEASARRRWATRSLDLAVDRLRARHPVLDIDTELLNAPPHEALLTAGAEAELLALGSHGLGTTSSLLLGSTSTRTAALADFPVILIRSAGPAPEPPSGPVLLALDAGHHPQDSLISLAFEEAALRDVPVRALYAWLPPGLLPAYPVMARRHGHAPHARRAENLLTRALLHWRLKFPDVRVEEVCLEDVPAGAVVAAARQSCLTVLGHRLGPAATGPRLGTVAQAAVRDATGPVVLVPDT
ncbi:universal stress protein [Streptomyces sp. NPDC050549]|uniref:universal stress protein n=1 Tax=Streptomyces sp. NPDC050549 TaxID=3155406 RepID=UPI003415D2F0